MIVSAVIQHVAKRRGAFTEIHFIDTSALVAQQFADFMKTELGASNGTFYIVSYTEYTVNLILCTIILSALSSEQYAKAGAGPRDTAVHNGRVCRWVAAAVGRRYLRVCTRAQLVHVRERHEDNARERRTANHAGAPRSQ